MTKVEIIKNRLRYVPIIVSSVSAMAALFAPKNIENTETALLATTLRHAIPECTILLALSLTVFLPRPFMYYFQSALQNWRNAFNPGIFPEPYNRVATFLPFALLLAAAILSIFPITDYARARYAYWIKGGLQRDFDVEQLRRAYAHEGNYDFESAIRKYTEISKNSPASKNTSQIAGRIALNKGLLSHAEKMHDLGKKEENQNGVSRAALELYLESLRVDPRHVESRQSVMRFRQTINGKLIALTPLVDACVKSTDITPASDNQLTKEAEFLFDLPAQFQPGSQYSSSSIKLCDIVQRFPNATSFMESVHRSWQLDRLDSILNFSTNVLNGKTMLELLGQERSNIIGLALPSLILPIATIGDGPQLSTPLPLPPLPR